MGMAQRKIAAEMDQLNLAMRARAGKIWLSTPKRFPMFATVLPLLLLGQVASVPPAASAAQLSPQQRFDAATQAGASGRCRDAIGLFEALESGAAAKKNPLVSATIALRKGVCLIRVGRGEEGESTIQRVLPQLIAAGAGYVGDVRDGRIALSVHASQRLDYVAAVDQARAALALATGIERVLPLMILTRLTAFDGGPEPLAYADEALALTKAHAAVTKENIAVVQSLHARVLLNQGRYKDAYAELKESLAKSGGLTMKVNLNDITVRSDLAIAAYLSGNMAGARLYLAYTGAGRMKDAPFAKATYMDPPACGETTGLKPNDFAIVEFQVGDDGSVEGVTPIYTTGGREVALQFTRAVSEWAWTPENAKAIPPFFRLSTRVELRCSAAERRPSLLTPLAQQADSWMRQQAGGGEAQASSAQTIATNKARLQRARDAGNQFAMIDPLSSLGQSALLPEAERIGYLDEALAIARAKSAPVAVRTALAIARLDAPSWNVAQAKRTKEALRSMLAGAELQGDALSLATVRLLVAVPGYRQRQEPDAEALLQAVINENGLAAHHPLKTAALLQRANLLARRGDLASAQQAFAQTGLTEEQCALIGIRPATRRQPGSNNYPQAAWEMGFEGWTRAEFDIAADGGTLSQRVVTAYPPFIFTEASAAMVKNALFESTFRPGGGMACSANSQSFVFRNP
jgi:outer membrane biosynthesis protein TonB